MGRHSPPHHFSTFNALLPALPSHVELVTFVCTSDVKDLHNPTMQVPFKFVYKVDFQCC